VENQTYDLVTTFSPIAKVDSMIRHLESGTVGCLSTQLGKIFYSLLWSCPSWRSKVKTSSFVEMKYPPTNRPPSRGSSPFLIWYASCNRREFRNLMFPLWFTLLGGFYCLPGHGSFHFVPCFPPPFFFGCFGLFMIGRVHP